MKFGSVKVLILEDDSFLGEALKAGLTREGHQVTWEIKPDEALIKMAAEKFDFVLVDCLLPQMTGVEFILKAREKSTQAFKSIVMSGIYTDKAFVQEAVRKSQAIAFLMKPFDLGEVTKLLKKEEGLIRDIPVHKQMYQIFNKDKITARDKKHIIETLDQVSGYDLPFIFSMLSETKSSGYLSIYYPDGVVSGVTFASGSVVTVDIEDKNTYLGEMLIQSGYITKDDLQSALEGQSKKRLGSRLIQGNFLSPHAFDLIMTEQMNVRISRTMTSQKLKVNFAESEIELTQPSIDSEQMVNYLHDWIASKIPLIWLKGLYISWLSHKMQISSNFKQDHPALEMSLVHGLEDFVDRLKKGVSISQLLQTPGYQELAVYKAIHFLLLKGLVCFSAKIEFKDEADQLAHLKLFKSQLSGKEPVEIADLLCLWEGGDAEKNFKKITENLGPKPMDLKKELTKVWKEIHSIIQDAISKTTDKNLRSKVKSSTPQEDAEAKLKANQLLEQVKKDLQYNHFQKAFDKLIMAQALTSQIYQFYLYMSWVKLGLLNSDKKRAQLKEIELELMQVPPDERYDALYPFVLGLYLKAAGDVVAAKKSFEKALALDSSFLVARRELGHLMSQSAKPKQDIFTMDLKQVVSGFFKKKG